VASYKAFLKAQFDAHAEEVFRAYPADTDSEARSAFLALTEDYQRGEAVRTLARDAVRIGERAYLYYFTYPSKGAYASQGWDRFTDWSCRSWEAGTFGRAAGRSG